MGVCDFVKSSGDSAGTVFARDLSSSTVSLLVFIGCSLREREIARAPCFDHNPAYPLKEVLSRLKTR